MFKDVSIYTGDKNNCVIKGNIIKSSSLRRVKQEENAARFRCLLFRYTGSYSQFISGCMVGSFRLLRLFHSLTQSLQFSFPFFAEHLSRVSLVYFNTPPREEIDGTRYELAAPWKSRRLGADFDNKKKGERRKERESDKRFLPHARSGS